MNLIPKKWADFQHYKDRCPPWIKLHRDLLNDKDFMRLPLASKALAPLLWLLASESKEGTFDASSDELEFRLRLTKQEVETGLKSLIDKGFFLDASTMLAPCMPVAIPETEERRGETEGKKREKRVETARGSRLPQDFQVDMQFAVDQGIQNCLEEAAKFRDYWNAQPGQRGTKLDWPATWRNWCRSARKTVPQQSAKTFAERDREAGWARWEEQTGRIHPDRQKTQQGHVIDVTPRNLEIKQ